MNLHLVKLVFNHFLCFTIPLYAFLFLTVASHGEVSVLVWIVPVWSLVVIDLISPSETRCQPPGLPRWLSDCLLLTLAALQAVNVFLLLIMAAQLQWGTAQAVAISLAVVFSVKVVVGTSSAFSCIVLAHELIHRKQAYMKLVGRFLLCLVCYEHFFTEHLRGHHRRFATLDDPATARFGESYSCFWRRTVPAQFKSAWQLESHRIGLKSIWDIRMIGHRVFQGIVFEFALILAILCFFGINAILVFMVQALAAVRKLEAINYFEHWGLNRSAEKIHATDSWDSESWFTLHTMVGLSRHADHHLHTAKPFYELRLIRQSPKLPYGYFAMIFFTVFLNKRFQAMATQELQNRRLARISHKFLLRNHNAAH